MFPRNRFIGNFDRQAWSDAHGIEFLDPSRAVQSQKDEADINTIVRNFGVTGRVPVSVRAPTYGDFEGISDYREAIEAVRSAEDAFMAVPAELRARLDNDAGKFVEWCADKGNLEEMRKLGLAPQVAAAAGGAQAE